MGPESQTRQREWFLCAGLKSLHRLRDFMLQLWHFEQYEVPLWCKNASLCTDAQLFYARTRIRLIKSCNTCFHHNEGEPWRKSQSETGSVAVCKGKASPSRSQSWMASRLRSLIIPSHGLKGLLILCAKPGTSMSSTGACRMLLLLP